MTAKYEKWTNFHCHQCVDCGYVWEHPSCCAGHYGSHTCPKCGGDHEGNTLKTKRDPQVTFLGRHGPGKDEPYDDFNDRFIAALAKMLERISETNNA
jgi:hypothetical protein